MTKWSTAPKVKLTQCIRLFVTRPGITKQREYRLCPVGGQGHGAQLQIMSPGGGDGSKPFIVGDVQKACRLTYPLVAYEKDYSPEAIASIRALHGAGMSGGFLEKLFGKKKPKIHPMARRIYMVKTKSGTYMPATVAAMQGARRRRRRRR